MQLRKRIPLWALAPLSPADTEALTFYALARGYAGVRNYDYDHTDYVYSRLYAAAGSTGWQMGCSPASARSKTWNGKAAPGNGQDRWNAMSASYNVVAAVESYALQPATTAPTCSAPLVCGAKSGGGGKLVTIVNFSSSSHSLTFNPFQYLGTGITSAWKVTSSNNIGCGPNSSGVTDCGIGPTFINGTQWPAASSATSLAVPAPTTTTTLTLQPLESDVFLYLQ